MSDEKLVSAFWAKVEQGPGCWIWTAATTELGYGKFRGRQATHVALEIDHRPMPTPGMHALHSCDNKSCVRPDHLRWGSVLDNAKDHRERHPRAKGWMTDEQVRELRASSERDCDAARRYGVSQSCIFNIRRGNSRKNA